MWIVGPGGGGLHGCVHDGRGQGVRMRVHVCRLNRSGAVASVLDVVGCVCGVWGKPFRRCALRFAGASARSVGPAACWVSHHRHRRGGQQHPHAGMHRWTCAHRGSRRIRRM